MKLSAILLATAFVLSSSLAYSKQSRRSGDAAACGNFSLQEALGHDRHGFE